MNFHPTLEGGMSIGSFGTPKTFRAPQNTTCYVRLNIHFQCLEIITHSLLFNSLISLLGWLVIWSVMTNKQWLVGVLVSWFVVTNKPTVQQTM